MDKHKRLVITMLVLMTAILTSQCIMPTRGTEEFSANIINPNGSVFAVGDHVDINGGFYDRGLGSIERTTHAILFANGIRFGEYTATYDYDVGYGFGVEWIPEEPGEYFLQEFASRPGRWAISAPVSVCVFAFPPGFWMFGYEGDCDIPDRSPEAQPGRLTFSAISIPDHLNYYFPPDLEPDGSRAFTGVGPDGCGSPSITFTATAGDPNDDIVFVKVDIQNYSPRPEISRNFLSLALNRLGGSSLETKVFGNIFTPELFHAEGGFYPISRDETYEVRWTAYAIGRSGETLAQDGPNTIPVEPCVIEEVPAPAPAEAPALDLEPSEENCPPGTYYAPVTNRCIEIQIPGSGGSDKEGEGGGCNKSVASCSAQGLSFDSNNCECVPIQ